MLSEQDSIQFFLRWFVETLDFLRRLLELPRLLVRLCLRLLVVSAMVEVTLGASVAMVMDIWQEMSREVYHAAAPTINPKRVVDLISFRW